AVQLTARHILPVAPAQHYETLPVVLEEGDWLGSVGTWVLPLRLEASARPPERGPVAGATEHPPPPGGHGPGGRRAARAGGRQRRGGAAGPGGGGGGRPAPTWPARAPPLWRWPSTTRSTFLACPPPSRCRWPKSPSRST